MLIGAVVCLWFAIYTGTIGGANALISTKEHGSKISSVPGVGNDVPVQLDIIQDETLKEPEKQEENVAPLPLGTPEVEFNQNSRYPKFASPWTYYCNNNTCMRVPAYSTKGRPPISLLNCKLTCLGKYGPLWPRPTVESSLSTSVTTFSLTNLLLEDIKAPNVQIREMMKQAFHVFKGKLQKLIPSDAYVSTLSTNTAVLIFVEITGDDFDLTLETDESYQLTVIPGPNQNQQVQYWPYFCIYLINNVPFLLQQQIDCTIVAKTFFGARHGLETVLQLIDYDEISNGFQIVDNAEITDKPAYPYRAITLDTSRNFIPIPVIKSTIDGMSYNKLNALHWHIIDSSSFPFYSKSIPELTQYGAYSSSQVYYPKEIAELVDYARIRGVRIIPEFDAPAHTSLSWHFVPEQDKRGEVTACIHKNPWYEYCASPPCAQLNPVNEYMYELLEKVYLDLFESFTITDIFHMGGDEVNYNCWNSSDEITGYMKNNSIPLDRDGFLKIWGQFQKRAYGTLRKILGNKHNTTYNILWSSDLTTDENLAKYLNNNETIIHIWAKQTDPIIPNALKNNFKVIFSNSDALYLGCGYGSWVGTGNNWCSPYKGWQDIYSNSFSNILSNFNLGSEYKHLILGAAVAMWSPQVDDTAVNSKIWPRAAALAERLWSDPTTSWHEAETRMTHNRWRLKRLGVSPDALQPQWCYLNDGSCYKPPAEFDKME